MKVKRDEQAWEQLSRPLAYRTSPLQTGWPWRSASQAPGADLQTKIAGHPELRWRLAAAGAELESTTVEGIPRGTGRVGKGSSKDGPSCTASMAAVACGTLAGRDLGVRYQMDQSPFARRIDNG